MHPLESLTPLGMLEVWGLRVTGSSLRGVERSSGGSAGCDDEMALCSYVEATPGFEQARPVLVHVYSRFLPLTAYRYRLPGETRLRAAMRHGQASLMLTGLSDQQLAKRIHDDFQDALIKRIRSQPFQVPPRPDELTAQQIAEIVEWGQAF